MQELTNALKDYKIWYILLSYNESDASNVDIRSLTFWHIHYRLSFSEIN